VLDVARGEGGAWFYSNTPVAAVIAEMSKQFGSVLVRFASAVPRCATHPPLEKATFIACLALLEGLHAVSSLLTLAQINFDREPIDLPALRRWANACDSSFHLGVTSQLAGPADIAACDRICVLPYVSAPCPCMRLCA
jgi:hypothetical protein